MPFTKHHIFVQLNNWYIQLGHNYYYDHVVTTCYIKHSVWTTALGWVHDFPCFCFGGEDGKRIQSVQTGRRRSVRSTTLCVLVFFSRPRQQTYIIRSARTTMRGRVCVRLKCISRPKTTSLYHTFSPDDDVRSGL